MQQILLSKQKYMIIVQTLKNFRVNMLVRLYLRRRSFLTKVVDGARLRSLLKCLNSLNWLTFSETCLSLLHLRLLNCFLQWQSSCRSHSSLDRLNHCCLDRWQLKFACDMFLSICKNSTDWSTLIVALRHCFVESLMLMRCHLTVYRR